MTAQLLIARQRGRQHRVADPALPMRPQRPPARADSRPYRPRVNGQKDTQKERARSPRLRVPEHRLSFGLLKDTANYSDI
jgi:hypothetical protein